MLILLIILFIYYLNKFNYEISHKAVNIINYNKFERLYFLIFVPYFLILNIIDMFILMLTRNLFLSTILFIAIETSSFYIYKKLKNSNKYNSMTHGQ